MELIITKNIQKTKDYISYEYYFGLLIEDKYLLTKFSDNELSMNLRFSFLIYNLPIVRNFYFLKILLRLFCKKT